MRKLLIHIAIFIHVVKNVVTREKGCSINTTDLDDDQPLILNHNFRFRYPDSGEMIELSKNDKLIISCGNENNFTLELDDRPFLNITCKWNEYFLLDRRGLKFEQFRCKKNLKHFARYTGRKCARKFQEIEIGFKIGNSFVRTIQICFDPELQSTFYAGSIISKWIKYHKSSKRVSWISDSFYDLNKKSADQVYSQNSQRKQINELLGYSPNSKAVVGDEELYLARGHLAAKADFFYGTQQKSTFHLVNAAPQWQSFNNGNWKFLEIAIRKLADLRKLNLVIYTGTHQILTMRNNKTNQFEALYLFSENERVGLPVPLFFWKIVFDPKSGAGVAFLGVNNPYIEISDVKKFQLCQDISEKISWVSFRNSELQRGYSYACSIRDFRKYVNYVPNLRVVSILT